jgi:UDP-glucuronate decarboxylase
VEGSIIACEKIVDATPVNLGWDKRDTIRDVTKLILDISGHRPNRIHFDTGKPEGPFSRALDVSRLKFLLEWQLKVTLEEGLKRTIDWHAERKQKSATKRTG